MEPSTTLCSEIPAPKASQYQVTFAGLETVVGLCFPCVTRLHQNFLQFSMKMKMVYS